MKMRWCKLAVLAGALGSAGCGGEDGAEPEPVKWHLVFEDLPGALISMSGTSAGELWAVGGNPKDGSGGFVLRYDGSGWTKIPSDVQADLWWVHAFDDGTVFAGGSKGTILRYQNGAFTPMTTPGTATIFGIWGVSPDDLWAVGGDPINPGSAFVWRYQGDTWQAPAGVPNVPVASWFKVWGRAANDVRIVGMDGRILHFDGTTFTEATSPTNRRLLTLYAEPGGRYAAVGGMSQAVILEDDGAGWKDVSPPPPMQAMIGVRLSGEDGYAAGTGGQALRRVNGAWVDEPFGFDVFSDFHSVFIDGSGGVWVAGGDILGYPLINGVLLHKGKKVAGGSYE